MNNDKKTYSQLTSIH